MGILKCIKILSLNIDTFLTTILSYSYDIFMEKRPELIKLGVKLIPLGIYFYKYPRKNTGSNMQPYTKMNPYIHNFMYRVKEFIISTFLDIITDGDNRHKYNYDELMVES